MTERKAVQSNGGLRAEASSRKEQLCSNLFKEQNYNGVDRNNQDSGRRFRVKYIISGHSILELSWTLKMVSSNSLFVVRKLKI